MKCVKFPTFDNSAASCALLLDAGSAQRLPMKKAKSCKVYYSILAICYLEVRAALRRAACRMRKLTMLSAACRAGAVLDDVPADQLRYLSGAA